MRHLISRVLVGTAAVLLLTTQASAVVLQGTVNCSYMGGNTVIHPHLYFDGSSPTWKWISSGVFIGCSSAISSPAGAKVWGGQFKLGGFHSGIGSTCGDLPLPTYFGHGHVRWWVQLANGSFATATSVLNAITAGSITAPSGPVTSTWTISSGSFTSSSTMNFNGIWDPSAASVTAYVTKCAQPMSGGPTAGLGSFTIVPGPGLPDDVTVP